MKSGSLLKTRGKIQISSADVREGDKLVSRKVSLVVCSNSIIRSSVSISMISTRKEQPKNRVSDQVSDINVRFWIRTAPPVLLPIPWRRHNIESCKSRSLVYFNSVTLFGVTSQSFAVDVNESLTQVSCKVQLTLGSQEGVREGDKLKVVRFPWSYAVQLQHQISNFGWRQHVDFGYAVCPQSDDRCP